MEQAELFPKNAFDLVSFKISPEKDESRQDPIKKKIYHIISTSESVDFLDEDFLDTAIEYFTQNNYLWEDRLFCINVARKLDPFFPFGENSDFQEMDGLGIRLIDFILELYENAISIKLSDELAFDLARYYAQCPSFGNFERILRSYCFLYGYETDISLSSLRSMLCLVIDKLHVNTAYFVCQLLDLTHDGEADKWIIPEINEKLEMYRGKITDLALIYKIECDASNFRSSNGVSRWKNFSEKYDLAVVGEDNLHSYSENQI